MHIQFLIRRLLPSLINSLTSSSSVFSPQNSCTGTRDKTFESAVIAEVCKLLGVAKTRTTPHHPQSDGLVERFNRTLLDMLATAVHEQPFEWERELRRLCLAYNTSVHPTAEETPFFLYNTSVHPTAGETPFFLSCSVAKCGCRSTLCMEIPPLNFRQFQSM